jgi:hypothetical protein
MRLEVRPAARRDLLGLPPDVSVRAEAHVSALIQDPRPPGCRLLQDQTSRV